MKTIELTKLKGSDYLLKHVISHMHYWRNGSNWIIQEGGRTNTAIQALLSIGADYLDVNTHEIIASACPGDMVVIPQGIRYEFRARSAESTMMDISNLPNGNFYWDGVKHDTVNMTQVANAIFLGFEMLDDACQPMTIGGQIGLVRLKEADALMKRMEKIARLCGNGFTSPALIKARTYDLLTSLSELTLNQKPRSSAYLRILPALEYIANQKVNTMTVKEMAEICNLSPSGFRKLFTQEMDVSPIRYVQERTLNRATVLLECSDLSISEIAVESGFQDAFYFSRFFRKMTGCAPTQWRKRRLNDDEIRRGDELNRV